MDGQSPLKGVITPRNGRRAARGPFALNVSSGRMEQGHLKAQHSYPLDLVLMLEAVVNPPRPGNPGTWACL